MPVTGSRPSAWLTPSKEWLEIWAEVLFQAVKNWRRPLNKAGTTLPAPGNLRGGFASGGAALAGMAPPQEESTPDKTDPTPTLTLCFCFWKIRAPGSETEPQADKAAMEEAAGLLWPEQYRSDMARLSNLINKYKFNEMAELLTSCG